MHNGIYCGHPEAFTAPGKWDKTDLTWWMDDPAKPLYVYSRKQQFDMIDNALSVWAAASTLRFKAQMHPRADIVVKWVTGEHGDGNPFDGPGRVLAHAYLPSDQYDHYLEGDIHMDESEAWGTWVDPLTVLIHEAGHSLGLGHSTVDASVMQAFYGGIKIALTADDKLAIQSLYGS